MQKEIEEIYKRNLALVREIEWAIHFFRIQNQNGAIRKTIIISDKLMEIIPLYLKETDYFNRDRIRLEEGAIVQICQVLLEAQEQKDYILLADYYELYLLPLLYDLQEKIAVDEGGSPTGFSAEEYGEYRVEYTNIGAVTLWVGKGKKERYFHSNKNPYRAALELADSWYQEERISYIVYGLGLGYHIEALALLDQNICIEVYESDKRVLELFKAYGAVEVIEANANIKIFYDKDLQKLSKRVSSMEKDEEFLIYAPSLDMLDDSLMKEWMEEYFLQYNNVKNQLKLLNANFRENIKGSYLCLDSLKSEFYERTLYLVGAGPSLDKNYEKLKEIPEGSLVIATGTSFRKLLGAGIRPDFVIETDANERIAWHFREVESETVPMLLLSTAAHKLKKIYAGDKYLFFQKEYEKSEDYAREKGYILYETGGSVMTAALDIGIRLGCRKIVFLGLDLAYTNNYAHAVGTSRREVPKESTGLKPIEAIDGSTVYTNQSFNIYRKWIEKRIAREEGTGIIFLDATEGGAKIKGTKIKTLSEVINEESTCSYTSEKWF